MNIDASTLYVHQQMLFNVYTSLGSYSMDTKAFMTQYQILLVSLKKIIMTNANPAIQQSFFLILKQLFTLMVYCRDIYGGLGRRDLSQRMLFIWNYHFPVPTSKCLHMMVLPIEDNPPYGSWRDMKGLCKLIREQSPKREYDPFIDTCIGLMNHQLDVDNTRWADALDEYNRKKMTVAEIPYPTAESVGLSLVARWIPRERSAYGWLFELCAIQYIRSFRPQYFSGLSNGGGSSGSSGSSKEMGSFAKALRKGKKEYRQIISRLSKVLDTLQIKQCGHNWGNIDPSHIPMNALMSQQQSLLNISSTGNPRKNTCHDKDRNLCAIKVRTHWLHGYEETKRENNHPCFIPMGIFVQKSLRLHSTVEQERLQLLWKKTIGAIQEMPFVFPILDLSLFGDHVETFYHYLSMALALTSRSTLFGSKEKRLLCFDNSTHWIDLSTASGNIHKMVQTMKPVYHQHHVGSDVKLVCSMIIEALEKSQMREEDCSKIIIVMFSTYSDEKRKLVEDAFRNASRPVPFLFWASGCGPFSSDGVESGSGSGSILNESFSCHTGAIPLVGYHNHLLSQISFIHSEILRQMTPYRFLSMILQNPRYRPIDSYFSTLLMGAGDTSPIPPVPRGASEASGGFHPPYPPIPR